MAKKKAEKPKEEDVNNVLPIKKPDAAVSLDRFKSTRSTTAGVDNVIGGMPHMKVGEVQDFFRTHPDEENYWSPEYCFVSVPVKGQKHASLHLIAEDLADVYLPKGKVQRFRLILATKPFDMFFLLHCPTQNLDNGYNSTALAACEQGKILWTQAISRKDEGVESYLVDKARNQDAFPDPAWPKASLDELIAKAFVGRMIQEEDHPALLRLIGEKQNLK